MMISKKIAVSLIFAPCFSTMVLAQDAIVDAFEIQDGSNEATYEFFVVEQRVSDFLRFMGRHTNTRFDLSERVEGLIRKRYLSGNVDDIVHDLADHFDLDMFEFNGVVYLSKKDESLTRMVRVGALNTDDVRTALTEIGMEFDKFPVSDAADGTAVVISAPPKLLAISEVVIENLPNQIEIQPQIRIRRGTHLNLEPLPNSETDGTPTQGES